ncbi:type 4a pilus biogenesis protein PilO [Porticoccaceae bacterium]|nr:type 4a pilus biogenesis protein PilO [Porticoccaceae bacterium]
MKNSSKTKLSISSTLDIASITDISAWSPAMLRACSASLVLLILLLFYVVTISDSLRTWDQVQNHQRNLIEEYGRNADLIGKKSVYEDQMNQLDTTIELLAAAMPSSSEVPEILEDITMAANRFGLVTSMVNPQSVVTSDLYAELPLKITISGSYQQLMGFLSALTQLNRFFSLHDFTVTASKAGTLDLVFLAKTYRLLPEEVRG